jgi:KDO2-lipid IV(A) lauroyltransferase
MIRLGLVIAWLLRLLPLALLAPLGRMTGLLGYAIARERRHVTLTNLRMCFPEWSDAERKRVACRHFQVVARVFLEHGILWWSSKGRIQNIVRIAGYEHYLAVKHRPVIALAPHFAGLNMGGTRLSTEWRGVSVYSRQKNPIFDRVLYHGRTRFEKQMLFSRQDGIRPVIKAMREGLPLYYLPDMDFGARDAVFVPFFGVPAATITGLARMARLARAVVVPAVTRQLPGAQGYELRFYPAWENYPTDDVEADTRRMNAFIEERVREMPEQYYWVHKRFKTRPQGEANPYG